MSYIIEILIFLSMLYLYLCAKQRNFDKKITISFTGLNNKTRKQGIVDNIPCIFVIQLLLLLVVLVEQVLVLEPVEQVQKLELVLVLHLEL